MKVKILLVFIVAALFINTGFAQTQTTYYNANGKRVSGPDSAAYKRVLSLSDTVAATMMYNITDYYSNGNLRLVGKISQPKGTVLEGRCVRYYQSGKIRQVANYTLGMMNGLVYDYYPNGKLYKVVKHELQRPSPNSFVEKMPLIRICNDSTGKALATDGDGKYIGYADDFKTVQEEGYIKDGLKVGQWNGEINNEKLKFKFKFIESYESGRLNSGKSIDENGTAYYYTARSISPVFSGGDNAFNLFLRDHIRYPAGAKKQNLQGRVYVSFMVESNGKLSEYKVQRSPGEALSAEALRVLNMSPDWQPGLWYGHPVSLQFTVPINFSLTN